MSDKRDITDIKYMREVLNEIDNKFRYGKTDKIVVSCFLCSGTGYDGYDRCDPPNQYVCRLCDGSGKLELKPFKGM